jgi:nucleoside-diphosphate-sugar epimerase
MFSKYRKYAADYRRIEGLIKQSGLDFTIIRPTMIYGNELDKNISKLVRIVNRFPIIPVVGHGRALMQPIYAADLAHAIAEATLRPSTVGREYNVAGKEPLTYLELLRHIARALGKKRYFVNVPYAFALAAGYVGELIPNCLINVERIQRFCEDKAFDYSLAREELDFNPRSFEEGIELEVKALRARGVI